MSNGVGLILITLRTYKVTGDVSWFRFLLEYKDSILNVIIQS